jgi:signal transduction histidine kinase
MTNSMFLLSTRRNVSFALNSEQDDIAECVKQSTHEMLPACIRKHLTISTDLEPCPASLDFERSQIEQVLVNLLENSAKFAPAHSSIEIRGYPDFWERRVVSPSIGRKPERRERPEPGPNCYRIDVCDDGPGVEPQMLHTLFEEYSSSAEGFNRCGSGLGLAICKAIMERHNGRIWVTPSAKGAVFSLALPLTPTRAVPLECTHGAHEETPQAREYGIC